MLRLLNLQHPSHVFLSSVRSTTSITSDFGVLIDGLSAVLFVTIQQMRGRLLFIRLGIVCSKVYNIDLNPTFMLSEDPPSGD